MSRKYIMSTWDGVSIVCPSSRTAKALARNAQQFTYSTQVRPIHTNLRSGSVLIDGLRQDRRIGMYERERED